MTLLALSDLALLRVFAHLPLADLLTVHQLHPPWRTKQLESCHKRTRMSLLLDVNEPVEPSIEYPHQDELLDDTGRPVFTLYDSQFHQIRLTFQLGIEAHDLPLLCPSILHLEVHHITLDKTDSELTLSLLAKWSKHLQSLVLSIHRIDPRTDDRQLVDFFAHFHRIKFPALQHLHLQFTYRSECRLQAASQVPIKLDLPILSCLCTFRLTSIGDILNISTSLVDYAERNVNLKAVSLVTHDSSDHVVPHSHLYGYFLISHLPHVASLFTHLPASPLNARLAHCTSLTQLHLILSNDRSWAELTSTLSSMHQLVYLKVTTEDTPDLDYLDSIRPLTAVRVLTLHYHGTRHQVLEHFQIDVYFPQLQILELLNSRSDCHSCRYELDDAHVDSSLLNECKHDQLQCLKRCPKLKSIYYIKNRAECERGVDRKVIWTVDEL